MSPFLAIALIVTLTALVAIGADLVRAIRGDGYGHRAAPRSLADDNETRIDTLARLAR